jgi:hypothetical protein
LEIAVNLEILSGEEDISTGLYNLKLRLLFKAPAGILANLLRFSRCTAARR